MKNTCFARTIALATSCVLASSAALAQHPAVEESLTLGHGSVEEKIIQGKLLLKTEFDFAERPLTEALREIAKKHGIDIQYDIVALRDAAIDPTAIPITLKVKDISLRSALKLLLQQNNLTYIIQDEVLQITTKEKANNTLRTVIYDVHDLVPVRENKRPDFASLIEMLTSTIAATTWSEMGGTATAAGFGPASLVVSQTGEVHEEIADLFAELRKLDERLKAKKPDDAVLYGWTKNDPRFEKLLAQTVDLQFTEKALNLALAEMSKRYGLEVAYDIVALRDAAVDPTAIPVTLNMKDISLRSALKMILAQNNLTYIFQDEVLQITTKDKANSMLIIRLYPVADLVAGAKPAAGGADENTNADRNQLLEILTNNIAAPTWSVVGGPGTLDPFDKAGGVFVVSQTYEVHSEIADLLSKLRTMRSNQEAAMAHEAAQPDKPETLVLKVYDLRASAPNAPAMTPQEIMEVVKGLVEPKSWTQPDVYIRGATGKLVVKQLPSVHRQVEKLLDELGAQVPKMPGAAGGRGGANNPGGGGF